MRRRLVAGLVVLVALPLWMFVAFTVAIVRYVTTGDRGYYRASLGTMWTALAVIFLLGVGSLLLAWRLRRRHKRRFANLPLD
jgi:ABC-type sulfate transport system permease component